MKAIKRRHVSWEPTPGEFEVTLLPRFKDKKESDLVARDLNERRLTHEDKLLLTNLVECRIEDLEIEYQQLTETLATKIDGPRAAMIKQRVKCKKDLNRLRYLSGFKLVSTNSR